MYKRKDGSYSYNVLCNFISDSGGLPVGSPIVDMAGDLYGITSVTSDSSYGGVAYKLVAASGNTIFCTNGAMRFLAARGLAYSGMSAVADFPRTFPVIANKFPDTQMSLPC
jgi:hypothetical protein